MDYSGHQVWRFEVVLTDYLRLVGEVWDRTREGAIQRAMAEAHKVGYLSVTPECIIVVSEDEQRRVLSERRCTHDR